MTPGEMEQLLLGLLDLIGRHDAECGGAMRLILNKRDPEDHAEPGEQGTGSGRYRLLQPPDHAKPMVVVCADLVAEANDQQLHKTALDRADEIGVGLHAIDEDDAVGLGSMPVQVQRHTFDLAERNDVHGGPNGRADALFVDAQPHEQVGLPLAVAPPCDPIAGTTKGAQPAARRRSTTARTIGTTSPMPRLPTATATRASAANANTDCATAGQPASMAATGSIAGRVWNRWRTSHIDGSAMSPAKSLSSTNG